MTHHLVIIAAPHHRLAGATRLPLAALVGESFVVREAGSGTRGTLEALFAASRLPLGPTLELGHNGAVKQSVAAGLGLAIMSTSAIRREIRAGRLVILDVEGFPIERQWHLIYQEHRRLPASAYLFCAFAEAWADEPDQSESSYEESR